MDPLRAFKGTGWDKDFEERDNYEENHQGTLFVSGRMADGR